MKMQFNLSLFHLFIELFCAPFYGMITKLFEKDFFSGIKKRSNRMEHLQKCQLTEPQSQDINKIEKNACQENGFQNFLSNGHCYK